MDSRRAIGAIAHRVPLGDNLARVLCHHGFQYKPPFRGQHPRQVGVVEELRSEVGRLLIFRIRWVCKDDVKLCPIVRETAQGGKDISFHDFAHGEPRLGQVILNHGTSRAIVLDKHSFFSTPTERFQSKGPGTGEKIEHPGSFESGQEHGEERFPDAIRGWTCHDGRDFEGVATGGACNDPHFLRSRFVSSMCARSSSSRSSLLRLLMPWATILSSKGSISRAMKSFLESTTG